MKRRQILTVGAVTAATSLAAGGAASAAPPGNAGPPGNGERTPPGLATKDVLAWAAGREIEIGSAVAGGGHHTSQPYPPPFTEDETYRELLGREFTSLSAENQMKWSYLRPDRDTYAFAAADSIMEFARRHGQVVRGHTLLWHSQNPAWLEEGGFGPEELRTILKDHIDTVVGRYAGHIQQWDVVNEIFTEDGALRESENIWIRELGPGIIADAFRWAHAADPQARLYVNDYNVEGVNAKSDAYHALVQDLLADGVPVHGFSTQGHLSIRYGFPGGLVENLERFADLGLETAITELDVRMDLPDGAEPTQEQLDEQAEYYRRMTEGALAADGCTSLTLWGFVDTYSWVPATFEGQGAATVMWADYTRKPAYFAVQDALARASRRAGHPALRD
ncbi:1,4-beta-xylanase [Brachybacterium sp. P6-10-X1]|uniref:endo-1,4-beta-xylanase n=1 Tax=Brachybacterium sp. P6-10-X1 TaxID=1903186 RepID=UPI000971B134|nr:endo-1,4-beta-xylanase [Brachybacterium sp. P6-10-X1]APX33817.1 1,4-beta-xylanase [Brachybacterium sp. P6-10-X1]